MPRSKTWCIGRSRENRNSRRIRLGHEGQTAGVCEVIMLRFNLRIAAILAVPVLLAGILAIHSAASPREGQMAQTRQTPQIHPAAQDAPWPPVATFSIL